MRDYLTESLTLALTGQEKKALKEMADEYGATMSGYLRKLIRDAHRRFKVEKEKRDAAND